MGGAEGPSRSTGGGKVRRRRTIEGGCFCNLVRYSIRGKPLRVVNCHCTMCRRASGAPYVTWITVRATGFTFTKMRPLHFSSSSKAERSFCDQCGTPITFQYKADRKTIDVTVGSLDDPDRFIPTMDIYTRSQVRWVPLKPGLKRYEGTITDE